VICSADAQPGLTADTRSRGAAVAHRPAAELASQTKRQGSLPLSIAIAYALTGALIMIVPIAKGEQPKSKEGDDKNRECGDKNDAHNRRQFDLKDNVRLIEFI